MTIRCKKCEQDKDPAEFHNNPSGKFGKQNRCKKCQAERNILEHRQTKQKWIDSKGGRCATCGAEGLHPAAYQFHHRNPLEKEFTLGLGMNRGKARVRAELDKCDLLCANCHATAHAKY